MTSVQANPVLDDARYAYETTDLVKIDPDAIEIAASAIDARMRAVAYSPRIWREHPLHLVPPEPFAEDHPDVARALDWIFLISMLNFSFWSDLTPATGAYATEWKDGWGSSTRKRWTGYHALLAAIDRSIEETYLITEPGFYSSKYRCSDYVWDRLVRPAPGCQEKMPMMAERAAVMRQTGDPLYRHYHNSFFGFMKSFLDRYERQGTALQFVQMVVERFPAFQDRVEYEGRTVHFWKRAQILAAEIWAAFAPEDASTPHPFFPHGVDDLTMFADYRVPQLLHRLRVLEYPPALVEILTSRTNVPSGSREEISIRAASILAVEQLKEAISRQRTAKGEKEEELPHVNSVLLDFYLWDLSQELKDPAKEEKLRPEMQLQPELPFHRTRSIWY